MYIRSLTSQEGLALHLEPLVADEGSSLFLIYLQFTLSVAFSFRIAAIS